MKIKRVDLATMWPDPVAALPVWLAENVDVLGDEAGLPLTKPVGEGDPRAGVMVPLADSRDSAVVFATAGAFDETMIGVAVAGLARPGIGAGVLLVGHLPARMIPTLEWLGDRPGITLRVVGMQAIQVDDQAPSPLLTRLWPDAAPDRSVSGNARSRPAAAQPVEAESAQEAAPSTITGRIRPARASQGIAQPAADPPPHAAPAPAAARPAATAAPAEAAPARRARPATTANVRRPAAQAAQPAPPAATRRPPAVRVRPPAAQAAPVQASTGQSTSTQAEPAQAAPPQTGAPSAGPGTPPAGNTLPPEMNKIRAAIRATGQPQRAAPQAPQAPVSPAPQPELQAPPQPVAQPAPMPQPAPMAQPAPIPQPTPAPQPTPVPQPALVAAPVEPPTMPAPPPPPPMARPAPAEPAAPIPSPAPAQAAPVPAPAAEPVAAPAADNDRPPALRRPSQMPPSELPPQLQDLTGFWRALAQAGRTRFQLFADARTDRDGLIRLPGPSRGQHWHLEAMNDGVKVALVLDYGPSGAAENAWAYQELVDQRFDIETDLKAILTYQTMEGGVGSQVFRKVTPINTADSGAWPGEAEKVLDALEAFATVIAQSLPDDEEDAA